MKYLAFMLATLALVPHAQAKPRDFAKQSITAKSAEGAVIFTAGIYSNRYEMWIARFDPITKKTSGYNLLPVDTLKSVLTNGGNDALIVKKLKPGRYVLQTLIIQSFFAGCLREKTVGFDVVAGKTLYLGRLMPQLSLLSIESMLRATGRDQTRGPIMQIVAGGLVPPTWTLEGALPLQPLLEQAKALKFSNDTSVETRTVFMTDFANGC